MALSSYRFIWKLFILKYIFWIVGLDLGIHTYMLWWVYKQGKYIIYNNRLVHNQKETFYSVSEMYIYNLSWSWSWTSVLVISFHVSCHLIFDIAGFFLYLLLLLLVLIFLLYNFHSIPFQSSPTIFSAIARDSSLRYIHSFFSFLGLAGFGWISLDEYVFVRRNNTVYFILKKIIFIIILFLSSLRLHSFWPQFFVIFRSNGGCCCASASYQCVPCN